jgi:hypothetical protein
LAQLFQDQQFNHTNTRAAGYHAYMTRRTRIPIKMRTALAAYDRSATKLLQDFLTKLEATTPPPMLYHYTNDVGLKGILESGAFWFTDIFGQNDPSELRHGLGIALKALRSRIADDRPEIATFASGLERFDVDAGIEQAGHFFICCFSSDSDDLSQWRAYADNGRGYALGFETALLEDVFCREKGRPIPQHSTFPVTYDDNELARLESDLADLVDPLISLPRKVRVGSDALHAYMSNLMVWHAMQVIRGIMFFKHEAYRNEKEYRFQQLFRSDRPAPTLKHRMRSHSLVRYREFDWRTVAGAALKEIVIGPAADEKKAERFARDCLSAFHATGTVTVVKSLIPYRAT